MQENIESIIREMAEDGYTEKEINCFVRGLHEGLKSVQLSMSGAKMEIEKDETDPLYIHTWNDVVGAVENMLDHLIKEIFGQKNGS